ncbi:hypothetical protein, partial [[Clostridium] symbiosum]|uniref:hypothetical protein n=1 Tax=Clostridium symbiosum TaxID=1512 RepID=UPI001D09834C
QGRCCPVRRLQGLIVSFVSCDEPPLPLKGIEQISGRKSGYGMTKTFASSVPVITFPWGIREKKIPQGTWEFIGTYR